MEEDKNYIWNSSRYYWKELERVFRDYLLMWEKLGKGIELILGWGYRNMLRFINFLWSNFVIFDLYVSYENWIEFFFLWKLEVNLVWSLEE